MGTNRNKFNTNFRFVEPLYKKAKISNRGNVEKTVPYYDRTVKLYGDDFNVKTVVTQNGANVTNVKRKINKEYTVILPGACENKINVEDIEPFNRIDFAKNLRRQNSRSELNTNSKVHYNTMLGHSNNYIEKVRNVDTNIINDDSKDDECIIVHKIPDSWLRVYPAPKLSEEPLYSVIVRCILCQLGLATFLIIWTVIAIFIVQSFEGPQEAKVSLEFEKEQSQLVIDLATELRQITPLSPRWRHAIEQRIEDERQLTMLAVSAGARLKPGQFWDLPGTFLFAVYIMTALGFGAPVPHTVWGRTSALIYAILAIPTHIFLMVNMSTCAIVRVEAYVKYLKDNFRKLDVNPDSENKRENLNCSRNSELLKSGGVNFQKHIMRCLRLIGAGHCVPLATISYYVIGVVSFGVLRSKTALETVMFPLEFTTTGGLERVEGYVRILYGFYVEGAMCLLACILAIFRRHSSSTFSTLSQTYRLVETDVCRDCSNVGR